MQNRFTAVLAARSYRGHYVLHDVKGPGLQRPHVWINCRYADLADVPFGAQISFQADIREYTRNDGSHGTGLSCLREVQVL